MLHSFLHSIEIIYGLKVKHSSILCSTSSYYPKNKSNRKIHMQS